MSESQHRILVVEDNPVMLDVVRFNLVRAGFEVLTARDGVEAVALLEAETFDLVLLDNQMPRMSGVEVCQHAIRQQCHVDVPFIMCSAKGLEMADETIAELNLHSVIFKPFSPRELVASVETAIATNAV